MLLQPTVSDADDELSSSEPDEPPDSRKSESQLKTPYLHPVRKSSEPPVRDSEIRGSLDITRHAAETGHVDLSMFREETRRRSLEEDMDRHLTDDEEEAHDGGIEEDAVGIKNLLKTFPVSEGLSTAEAEALLEEHGSNELPEKVTPKWLMFCRQLWQPMPVMIWLAAIIEGSIGNYIDTAILVLINLINATLSFYESNKAGNAVASLKNSLRPTAVCKRDGKWDHQFDATRLVPGDLIELASGAAVPADCMLNPGHTVDTDESAMTGETLPVTLHGREMAKMGGTVARGEGEATVVFTGKHTFFGKTASMLGDGEEHSNLQKLLLRIIMVLSALALVMGTTCFVYLMATGEEVKRALSFSVVVIVASIPMAVEIVVTTTLALGSRSMSRFGAIVSRLSAIEDLAGLNLLCSDKTGTLTKNKMEIQEQAPAFSDDVSRTDLLRYAALAARWDQPPKDALDTLVLRCPLWFPEADEDAARYAHAHPTAAPQEIEEYKNTAIQHHLEEALSGYEQLDFVPFDPRFKRTQSTIRVRDSGIVFKVTKGAPHVLAKLDPDSENGEEMEEVVTQLGEDGIRCMAIAISDPINNNPTKHINSDQKEEEEEEEEEEECTWHLMGLLTFLDPPRSDTKSTIHRAQALGVPVRMITGDHVLIAKKTARDLQMGECGAPGWPRIRGPAQLPLLDSKGRAPGNLASAFGELVEGSDGFAQVFPEHKFLIVECYRRLGYKTGMTGDGVNDAPALKRADVGIAVAGATDAARAAADIVLTEEGLSTIVLGLEIARKIFHRMKSFLMYRISATLQLLFFFFIALFAFHSPSDFLPGSLQDDPAFAEWPSFFQLPVIFLMIITVINDGTLISVGYDKAIASKRPERWCLPALFVVGGTLACIACFSSLLLLYFSLDSWQPDSLFQRWGIGGLEYGEIINAIFLKVAVSDVLTLFSARTGPNFFWSRVPHWLLVVACACALTTTTLLALLWPCTDLDEVPVCGLAHESGQFIALWVWLYCIVFFFIQDAAKVMVFRMLLRFNLFDINATHLQHEEVPLDEVIVREDIE